MVWIGEILSRLISFWSAQFMCGNYFYYPPLPQHFLYFRPLPHIQEALRPILGEKVIEGWVSGFSPGLRSLSTSVMSSGLLFSIPTITCQPCSLQMSKISWAFSSVCTLTTAGRFLLPSFAIFQFTSFLRALRKSILLEIIIAQSLWEDYFPLVLDITKPLALKEHYSAS